MRLVIQFSSLEGFQFRQNDVLLTTKKFIDSVKFDGEKYSISHFEFPETIYLEQLLEKEAEIYQSFNDTPYISNALKGGFNNFFNHIYGTCVRWTFALEQLLEQYNFTEIILSDRINNDKYLPYYEAEGEINRQLFYKPYDFIPDVLMKFLADKKIKISIYRKRSSFLLKFRIFLRRTGILHLKLILLLYRKLHFNLFNRKHPSPTNQTVKFIFLTRGTAHTHYMLPYVEQYKQEAILHVADGFVSESNNLNFCSKRQGLHYVPALKYLYLRDVFKEYLLLMRSMLIITFTQKKAIQIGDLSFNLASCLKEMMSSWFDTRVYTGSIQRYLEALEKENNHKIALITGEMFTAFPLAIDHLAKDFGYRSIQLQTTLMMYKSQTNFIHCDKYLFKSRNDFNYYRQNKNLNLQNLAFWGSTGMMKKVLSAEKLTSIVFFTQPYENEHEIELVEQILNYTNNHGINLSIKLHPRDNERKFARLGELNFISPDEALTDYIAGFQLAILRTSSIGRELIEQGIPTIFCLTSDSIKRTQAEYLDRSYGGVIFDFTQLINHLDNYKALKKEYIDFRQRFLQYEKSLVNLSKSLNQYLESDKR